MQYFDQICKKMGSKKPLLLSNKPYANDIFKMFYPKTENIIHFSILFDMVDPMTPYSINNHRYIFPFTRSYFTKLEKKHKQGENCHFYENLIDTFGLDPAERREPEIRNEDKENVENLIKNKALGDRFVIVSPHAASNDSLSQWFWDELCVSLNTQGYAVFLNTQDCGLNLAAYRYMASKSKAVIGVRSGALDLSADVAPMTIAYYLPFRRRHTWDPIRASHIMNNFSLKRIPGCELKQIHEYDVCQEGEYAVMERTLNLLNDVSTVRYTNEN